MNPNLLASLVLAQGETKRSLLDYVTRGGPVGLVIIAISVAAIGMIVAQWLRVRREVLAPPELADDLRRMLAEGDVDGAIARCSDADKPSFLSRVMGQSLTRSARSPFGMLELRTTVEETGRLEVDRLYRLTDGIGLVASVTPMLGLLGTVIGMVGAFDAIMLAEGPARPDQLAGSISQALITTVLGLIVAIPCTAAYTFLRNRIDHLTTEIGESIDTMIAPLEVSSAETSAA
jgi:biopolymer transport protein ExbB|tara:strand:- start:3385 stop:4083 length:699 start_codon:yes stop_codon:yes gene_type:complete